MQGRIIDAWGKMMHVLAKKQAGMNVEGELKSAVKKLARVNATNAVLSAFALGLVHLFANLYAKEDDEEDGWLFENVISFVSNLLGGLPVISQIYSKLFEGFEIKGTEYSFLNEILDAVDVVTDTISKTLQGKATSDDLTRALETLANALGQAFGVPTRNIKNTLLGLTNKFFPEVGYRIEDLLGAKKYSEDLKKALAAGDDDLVLTIIELATKERLGSGLSEAAIKELARLSGLGESILPSAMGDKITVDGEERELSGSELSAVREIYSAASAQLSKFIESDFYAGLTDEQKAAVVRKVYDLYECLAYDLTLGTEKDAKAKMLLGIVGEDALVTWDAVGVLESDKDEDGKTISGSLKKKVIAAIWDMDIPDIHKVMLISTKYTITDGDIEGVGGYAARMALYEYIGALEMPEEERLKLYEVCGFEVKGGAAQMPTYGSSSGGGSKKVTKIGHVVGGGTMKGTMIGSMIGKDYSKKIIKLGKIVN